MAALLLFTVIANVFVVAAPFKGFRVAALSQFTAVARVFRVAASSLFTVITKALRVAAPFTV